ncbi:hypothetical protein [Blastococcus haudaquaticus]|uniref:SPW repeat-containing protein n=1 Tax=Blastococcus haudaquaticus TaxID=1938745 RepID=A0A286H5X8_9ACTN|nr:hypothetical protein [Blastococcus haudaquaticus]SOE02729.1 hypothetical protein SAMN06272739_3692 [Blastococcus haudaquaticus]
MSVADAPQPPTVERAAPQPAPEAPPARPAHAAQPPEPAAPWNLPAQRRPALRADGLGRDSGRLLAIGFALAWILCPAIEPMPTHHVDYPLWQLPIELAALGTIVAAVVALWRGNRNSARYGLAAGALMAVMTMVCPLAGHTPVGWWTWVQTGLSLAVMATSAVLHRYRPA